MAELKPCPFCGGEAYSDKIGKPLFTIRCTNIDCYAEISKVSYEEAIEAWNTRKPIEAVVAELEELKDTAQSMWDDDDYFLGKANGIGNAIEIVRNGGKE